MTSCSPIIPEVLHTPRLMLRMFGEADWEGLCEMFDDAVYPARVVSASQHTGREGQT